MANLRLITQNAADAAALSAVPAAAATLPVTNLQDQTRERVWRSTSNADQTIKGDFPGLTYISAMALMRHNLTPNATLRLKLFDGFGQTGTVLYDSGDVTIGQDKGYGNNVYGIDPYGGSNLFTGWAFAFTTLWFATQYAQSFSLVMSDAANPDGYLQASRLVLGTYFEPAWNMSYGIKLSWVEDSKQSRTDGGSLRTDGTDPYRRWSYSLAALSDAERSQLLEVIRKNGLRKDMFLSCFPEAGGTKERDYAGLAKAVQIPELNHSAPLNFETELVMEEA